MRTTFLHKCDLTKFKQHEQLQIHTQVDADGFYRGTNDNNETGLIPSNFVELVEWVENQFYELSPTLCIKNKPKHLAPQDASFDTLFRQVMCDNISLKTVKVATLVFYSNRKCTAAL